VVARDAAALCSLHFDGRSLHYLIRLHRFRHLIAHIPHRGLALLLLRRFRRSPFAVHGLGSGSSVVVLPQLRLHLEVYAPAQPAHRQSARSQARLCQLTQIGPWGLRLSCRGGGCGGGGRRYTPRLASCFTRVGIPGRNYSDSLSYE